MGFYHVFSDIIILSVSKVIYDRLSVDTVIYTKHAHTPLSPLIVNLFKLLFLEFSINIPTNMSRDGDTDFCFSNENLDFLQ